MEIFDLRTEQMILIIEGIERYSSLTNEYIIMNNCDKDVRICYYSDCPKNGIGDDTRRIEVWREWKRNSVFVRFVCKDNEDMRMFRDWAYHGFSIDHYVEKIEPRHSDDILSAVPF